jgi:hypothetical protein
MKMRLFPAVAPALLIALLTGGAAHAADRKVEIVNKTGMSLTHFYASNTGTRSWEEDILGRDVLADGESVTVDINDGTGACKFDFKASFENGGSLEKTGIDVCVISTYTYTP